MSSPISGFTAIPNPQMLAFMPIQSYLMMYFAGGGWQIGKRKISAIPNDKFNVMSAKDLLEAFTADLRETIPTLERSLQDITPLIKTLIEQYGEFVTIALKEIPQAAQGVIESQLTKEGTLSKLIIEVVGGGTVTGGGAGSQALLFAQKQLQDEVDRLNAEKLKLQQETTGITATTTSSPFVGPEINPATGEQSTFLKNVLNLPSPASHITPRPVSNASLQSLRLTLADLQFQIRRAGINHKNALAQFNLSQGWPAATKTRNAHKIRAFQQNVGLTSQALKSAQQNLANFMKMHGSRL